MTAPPLQDQFTGLPNPDLFRSRLEQVLAVARRENRQVALLIVDVDGFRRMNDLRGVGAGNRLLRQIGELLTGAIRCSASVCRYAGDKFLVMLPHAEGSKGADAVARTIHERVSSARFGECVGISLTARIGIALYPAEAKDAESLIRRAEQAIHIMQREYFFSPVR